VLELIWNNTKYGITDTGIVFLTDGLKSCGNLVKFFLTLAGNQHAVTDKGLCYFSTSLNYLSSLRELKLDISSEENEITDKSLCSLANALPNTKYLKRLSLWLRKGKNSLGGQSLISLANALSDLKYLERLDVFVSGKQNNVHINAAQIFCTALRHLKYLTELQLSLCNAEHSCMTAKGLSVLFKEISYYSNLQTLCYQFSGEETKFTDENLLLFSNSLKKLKKLQELFLLFRKTEVTNDGLTALYESLTNKSLDACIITFEKSNIHEHFSINQTLKKVFKRKIPSRFVLDIDGAEETGFIISIF